MEAAQKGPDREAREGGHGLLRHRIRSGVGTAAEKDQAGGGDEDQTLLVGKVVRAQPGPGLTVHMHPLSPALQARRIVGQEPDAGKKLGARRDIVKARSVGEELLGHAQIFSGVAPQDIAGLRGLLPQIEGRGGVALEKGAEAAGVVVVPVGEDGGVHTDRSTPNRAALSSRAAEEPASSRMLCPSCSITRERPCSQRSPSGAVFSIRTVTRTALTPPSS